MVALAFQARLVTLNLEAVEEVLAVKSWMRPELLAEVLYLVLVAAEAVTLPVEVELVGVVFGVHILLVAAVPWELVVMVLAAVLAPPMPLVPETAEVAVATIMHQGMARQAVRVESPVVVEAAAAQAALQTAAMAPQAERAR